MKTLSRMVMECWCGIGDSAAVNAWAADQLRNNPDPHPDIAELFHKPHQVTETLLRRIARDVDGFEPVSAEGKQEAIEILIESSEKLLRGEIDPDSFCGIVSVFDSNFWTTNDDYPEWLGHLWLACQWHHKPWTDFDVPNLTDEVQRMLLINMQRNA